jgi:hypothetical protein
VEPRAPEKANVAVVESVGLEGADVMRSDVAPDAARAFRLTTTLACFVAFFFEGLAASAPGDAAQTPAAKRAIARSEPRT